MLLKRLLRFNEQKSDRNKSCKYVSFLLQDFLESEGIEVNSPEGYPLDPYIENRKEKSALRTYKTPSDFDKLRQFLEMDRKVLRFFVLWDDRDAMFGEMRKFVIHVSMI